MSQPFWTARVGFARRRGVRGWGSGQFESPGAQLRVPAFSVACCRLHRRSRITSTNSPRRLVATAPTNFAASSSVGFVEPIGFAEDRVDALAPPPRRRARGAAPGTGSSADAKSLRRLERAVAGERRPTRRSPSCWPSAGGSSASSRPGIATARSWRPTSRRPADRSSDCRDRARRRRSARCRTARRTPSFRSARCRACDSRVRAVDERVRPRRAVADGKIVPPLLRPAAQEQRQLPLREERVPAIAAELRRPARARCSPRP